MSEGTTQAPPDLIGALAQALEDDRESWPRDGRIYASDLGTAEGEGGCPRAYWHKLRDAPTKELTPGVLLMFKQGNALEDLVIDLLTKKLPEQGWVVSGVQGRTLHPDVGGRYDIKLKKLDTDEEFHVIVDVKTKRGGAFQYLNEPKTGDVLQVQFYLREEDADFGLLLYIDREGQNFGKQFVVARDDEAVEASIQAQKALRDQEEPPPIMRPTVNMRKNKGPNSVYLNVPWQVNYCSLKECECAEAMRQVPDKIVAKVDDDGAVRPTEGNERFVSLVASLLSETYPDEGPFYVAAD